MESEQERFTHTMDLLELEVAGLEQHEDLALVDRVSKLVGEISGRISEAENKGKFVCLLALVLVFGAWVCVFGAATVIDAVEEKSVRHLKPGRCVGIQT